MDRTQPTFPMVKGRAATMTPHYKRHGTTTLFAALDVLTGKVTGVLPSTGTASSARFLKTIDLKVPRACRCICS